jgi:phage gp36-like protein
MPYLDRSALEQRYGVEEVAQRLSALAEGSLDTIVTDATSMIDGYLASRYTLPLSPVPEALVANACAIARYKLLGDAVTEHARDEYRDAVVWLRDIAAGRVVLQESAPVPGNAPDTVVMLAPTERVFGRSGRP